MVYKRRFCVYIPENHGVFRNSENNIESEYIEFYANNNRFYLRQSYSWDGILYRNGPWFELNQEQFFMQLKNAEKLEKREFDKYKKLQTR
jgi:hypothetical protein